MRFAVALLLVLQAVYASAAEGDVFLWASTGGGWRAMCACFGFANAFQKAGLFSETESKFRSIVRSLRRLFFLAHVSS